MLGCNRLTAGKIGMKKVAKKFNELSVNALVIIGGFEAYKSIIELTEHREEFSEFRIPLVCIPATISNNVPGSDISIGSDTALNEITSVSH